MRRSAFYILLSLIAISSFSQTSIFRENGKWGIKENNNILIRPIHDTIFNFDSTGKVCLGCNSIKSPHPNKYIKTPVYSFQCRYYDRKGNILTVKDSGGDTTSTFDLLKNTVKEFNNNSYLMRVAVKENSIKDHKFLITKDFTQLTFKRYDDIHFTQSPEFLKVERKNDNNVILCGLINMKEEALLPFAYSNIKVNPDDSLIIGCTAGLGPNSEDDIFDFSGKKISSHRRHVELATKKLIVYRVFLPEEHLTILDLETKKESNEHAEEVKLFDDYTLLMANEGHWFTYDVKTKKKKAYESRTKK